MSVRTSLEVEPVDQEGRVVERLVLPPRRRRVLLLAGAAAAGALAGAPLVAGAPAAGHALVLALAVIAGISSMWSP